MELVNEELTQPIVNQLVEISNMNFSFQRSLKDKINTHIGKS